MLANHEADDGPAVRARFEALLAEVRTGRAAAGYLAPAADHFLKVTASYASGLFHCYAVAGLPRTDNDLEHVFGSARLHERRTTGRKVASPALVLRGAVRVVAAVASRQRPHPFWAADLCPHRPAALARWRALRAELTYRHEARRAQLRFRRAPAVYLAALEGHLLQ